MQGTEPADTPASSSKQAARAAPMGSRSLYMLCADDAENSKQPGFYVEPFYVEPETPMPCPFGAWPAGYINEKNTAFCCAFL